MQKMKEFLNSLPIDTGYERNLLESLCCEPDKETLLVIGDQQAAPYTLLPLKEQIFTNGDNPGFPVVVEFGEAFSIRAASVEGEQERYQTAGDFVHFCSDRYNKIRKCTVTVPDEMLRQCHLVYFRLDGNLDQLYQAAKGCSGCIMVMAADAGGLSEDYLDLCKWLTQERCISERVSLILNHRGPFGNIMLPRMTKNALKREEIGVFKCGAGAANILPVPNALQAAMQDIQARSGGEVEAGVLLACCESISKKLVAELEAQKTVVARCGELREKYTDAGKAFRAICATEKYGISELLTQKENENIRKEISGMFAVLRDRFPKMVDEVVVRSQTPKEDLKNLATDYPGTLMDAFIDSLLEEVSVNLLIPRTHERFMSVCERFRRMMQDAQLEYEEMEACAETEFLRMGNINVGDHRPPFAQIVSFVITTAIKMLLTQKIPKYGYRLGVLLESVIGNAITNMTVAVMPTKQYARSLCKAIMNELEKQEQNLYEQVENTILPRLASVLQEEFETLTGIYNDQLCGKAKAFADQQTAAEKRVLLIQEKLDQLAELAPEQKAAEAQQL